MTFAPFWMRSLRVLPIVLLVVSACGDDDNDANDDDNEVTVSEEPAGDNCELGGTAITSNGSTHYVCKDTSATLIVSSTEAAGANCAYGGTKLQLGLDHDENGTLDANEVESTQYDCNQNPYGQEHIGSLSIYEVSDFDATVGITLLGGDVYISLSDSTSLSEASISDLRYVDGSIYIECLGEGGTLHFPSLEAVTNDFEISGSCGAISVDAPKLKSIGNSLYLTGSTAGEVSAPALEHVGYLQIYSTANLVSLSLPALESTWAIYFYNTTSLNTLSLPSLTSISYIQLYWIANLSTFDLPAVTSLDSVYIYLNGSTFDTCGLYDMYASAENAGTNFSSYNYPSLPACTDNASLCPFVNVNGNTDQFRACYSSYTWDGARTQCQSLGSGWDLAYFTSDADFQTLSSTVQAAKYRYWFGYSDVANEGTYTWVQNVSGNTYAPQDLGIESGLFWDVGQPDGGTGESCAESWWSDPIVRVNDLSCDSNVQPLCRLLQ